MLQNESLTLDKLTVANVVAELLTEHTGSSWEVLSEDATRLYAWAADFIVCLTKRPDVMVIGNPHGAGAGPKWCFTTSAADIFDGQDESLLKLLENEYVKECLAAAVNDAPMPVSTRGWREQDASRQSWWALFFG